MSMLSFLSNRHYLALSKELPECFRTQQPRVIYLPSHASPKVALGLEKSSNSKLKLKRSKQMGCSPEIIGDCCPICYSTDNIAVAYYGRKHVCVKCRKLMRDEHGNQTRIFLDENGQILCLGLRNTQKKEEGGSKAYYYTDYTRLQINGRSAFATFAGPDEMVLILRAQE